MLVLPGVILGTQHINDGDNDVIVELMFTEGLMHIVNRSRPFQSCMQNMNTVLPIVKWELEFLIFS